MLKAEVARIREKVARSREEVVQEYKDNFKDTDDCLDLMRDAVAEYKMAVKKVDPTFDSDYYNNLIFGKPQTPALEDPVGFEELDPIGTPRAASDQDTTPVAELSTDATI